MNLHERRQARALELGDAASACDVAGLGTDEQLDLVLAVSGALPGITDRLGRLRKRGTFIQMGGGAHRSPPARRPVRPLREGVVHPRLQLGRGLLPAGRPDMLTIVDDMRSLITHRVSLEDFDEAVSAMGS